jgi:hypothetical protein
MKTSAIKKHTKEAITLLKNIDLELKAILEEDIRNFDQKKGSALKNAAFLQLIAA